MAQTGRLTHRCGFSWLCTITVGLAAAFWGSERPPKQQLNPLVLCKSGKFHIGGLGDGFGPYRWFSRTGGHRRGRYNGSPNHIGTLGDGRRCEGRPEDPSIFGPVWPFSFGFRPFPAGLRALASWRMGEPASPDNNVPDVSTHSSFFVFGDLVSGP